MKDIKKEEIQGYELSIYSNGSEEESKTGTLEQEVVMTEVIAGECDANQNMESLKLRKTFFFGLLKAVLASREGDSMSSFYS